MARLRVGTLELARGAKLSSVMRMIDFKRISAWAAAVIVVCPSVAAAADWWAVASNDTAVALIDAGSISKTVVNGKSVVRAWITTGQLRRPDKDGAMETKAQSYFDCSNRSSAQKSYIDYNQNQDVLTSHTNEDYALHWSPIAPETFGDAELDYACFNDQVQASDKGQLTLHGNPIYRIIDMDDFLRNMRAELAKSAQKQK